MLRKGISSSCSIYINPHVTQGKGKTLVYAINDVRGKRFEPYRVYLCDSIRHCREISEFMMAIVRLPK